MSQSNEELAEQLKEQLMGGSRKVAFSDDSPQEEVDNPLESDFFKAINAFRAARNSGDEAEVAAAEERLREVVRGELTGESCEA